MRNSIEELNQRPPEFSVDSAKEITPPPDEFNRTAARKKPEKKRSSLRKVMLYLASAGLVTLGVIKPVIRVDPPEGEPAAVQETPSPSAVAEAVFTPAAAETPAAVQTETNAPAPTPVPVVTPEPTEVPPLTGKIHVVVYSEIPNYDNAPYPSEILAEDTLDAATFREYKLPPLPTQEGYQAVGYVLTKYSGLAYLETLYYEFADPEEIGTKALGDTLTANDLGMVPRNTDGVYEAEIHVVWLEEDSKYHLEFYDETLIGQYDVGFPVSSDGLCYLAAFPTPQREGKAFTGWSNASGTKVDAVTYFDFFPAKPNAQSMEDREWSHPCACRVYACWSDGTGGPPVTPAPTEAPTEAPATDDVFTITGEGCSIVANGKYVVDGSFAKGTVVTVNASSRAIRGRFVMKIIATGETSSSGAMWGHAYRRYDKIFGEVSYWYSYSTTFVVTGDAVIIFVPLGGA